MKPLLILTLLVAQLNVAVSEPATNKFELQFPKKKHLTATQVYKLGYPANAIDKVIGQFVLLDVEVMIARDVPLALIEMPPALAKDSKSPPQVITAHLISATSIASSRKKGERLRIEGIIVEEGYGAYTIYLHNFQLIQ